MDSNVNCFDQLIRKCETSNDELQKAPLLAHYTTVFTLEKILSEEELWFSNPLLMNDWDELKHGVITGVDLFRNSEHVREVLNTVERYDLVIAEFNKFFENEVNYYALDTYVFCLTEHNENDDGRLSMWRAYGEQGDGAALVFNVKPLLSQNGRVPFLLKKVDYVSAQGQVELLRNLIADWCDSLRSASLSVADLPTAANVAFQLIKHFALTTKHIGFAEEKEWRIVYTAERDHSGLLTKSLSYAIGNRGVEPKLKFRIEPLQGLNLPEMSLSTFLEKIVLGPSNSQPLRFASLKRMIDVIKQKNPKLRAHVVSSSIPFRNT